MSLMINAIELLVKQAPSEKIDEMHGELMAANGDEQIIAGVLAKLFAEFPKEQISEFMAKLYSQKH